MKQTPQTWIGLAALLLGACAEPAPPPPPPPPPPPTEPAPPPPAPKCEAIKEQCKADASTRARLPGGSHRFTPPEGWVYAQLEEATVAQAGDTGPVLLLAIVEPEQSPQKAAQQRVDRVNSLAEIVLLDPPTRYTLFKRRTPGKKDYAEQEMAGLKMSLWERPGAKRGEDDGPLLIVSAPLGDGRDLLAIGFAPKDDKEGTGAILAALRSLEKSSEDDADAEEASSEGEAK